MLKVVLRVGVIFLSLFAIVPIQAGAQTSDSIERRVDIVYLHKGAIMGDIQTVNTLSGVLTIRDLNGRVFVLQSSEYRFYVEDQVLRKRKKKDVVIHERKESGIYWAAETGLQYLNIHEVLNDDDFFIGGETGYALTATYLRMGVGKIWDTRNEADVFAQLGGGLQSGSSLAIGGRYSFMYGANENNLLLQIPIELTFSHNRFPVQYSVKDTVFNGPPNPGWSYPRFVDSYSGITALGISVGHGIGKVLKKGHLLSWEVRLRQNFTLMLGNEAVDGRNANNRYSSFGFESGLRFRW